MALWARRETLPSNVKCRPVCASQHRLNKHQCFGFFFLCVIGWSGDGVAAIACGCFPYKL